MSIYFGNDTVNDLYVGLTPVSKGYVGTHLFYDGDNTIIDLTYEKYILNTQFSTLYNTEEAPIKSAILKGCTLVNLSLPEITTTPSQIQKTSFVTNGSSQTITIVNNSNKVIHLHLNSINGTYKGQTIVNPNTNKTLTLASDEVIKLIRGTTSNGWVIGDDNEYFNKNVFIVVGDLENQTVPYFEGMQSVKMPVLKTTGKNLLYDVEWEIDKRLLSDGSVGDYIGSNTSSYINVSNLDVITFSGFLKGAHCLYDKDKSIIGGRVLSKNMTIDVSGVDYIRVAIDNKIDYSNPQMEAGSVATSYEPHKSNILSTPSDLELRGIGDVRDELDLLTGEVVNKFGEVVLNGDENWSLYGSQPNQVNTVAFSFSHTNHDSSWANGLGYCDKMLFTNGNVMYIQDLECVTTDANHIIIRVSKTKVSSVDEFKAWLSNHNIRVVYPLKEEVIKTVDLSTVNQDENNTKLSTFNDMTHVTLSSEGLIPEAELEVATKNEEVLNTMSLEMDDISTTQNALRETSNTQSENVDATMMATTEIYEQLL